MATSDDRLDLDTFPPVDYALPETRRLSSTPGKSILPNKQFNVLAIYTGINDDYILSKPTAMPNSAD